MKQNRFFQLTIAISAAVLFLLTLPSPVAAYDGQPNAPEGNISLDQASNVESTVLAVPSTVNFDTTIQALTDAINSVNAIQTNGSVDLTDLNEDYDDFNREKYEEVLAGKRTYKYLHFEEYWKEDGATTPLVRAVVKVPNSEDTSSETAYLEAILDHMQNVSHLNVSGVNAEQKKMIVKDIAEIDRLTCIKVLRLAWAIFGDTENGDKGLFPQVYQADVVQAGDLSSFVEGGINLFSENNMHVIQPARIKHANVSNEYPEARPDIFNNTIVAYFRPQSPTMVDGHIGIGKIYSESQGSEMKFSISTFDVDGETGRAFFNERMNLEDFTRRLYPENAKPANLPRNIVGWFYNR